MSQSPSSRIGAATSYSCISRETLAASILVLVAGGRSALDISIALILHAGGVLLPASLVWPGIRYTLHDDILDVQCSMLRWRIPLSGIERIAPTSTDATSSPAPSLDRIRIDYRAGSRRRHVLVLPVDKNGFLDVNRARTQCLSPAEI